MTDISLTNVCRLCLSKDHLVWVFDKRFEDANNMKCVIYVTTGVQIHITDAVSQKICEKCCHVIIKMYEFRRNSLQNDKHLREKLKKLKGGTELAPIKEEKPEEPADPKQEAENNSLDIHPTIRELFTLHPHIKLPRVCLKVDVKPMVVMKMGAVEDYFSDRQLNFQEHCRQAMKERRTARKKTLGSPQKLAYFDSPPCSINGEIIPNLEGTPEKGVLRPIKIKIIPKMLDIEENNPQKTKESKVQNIAECHKKRKLSETEGSSTKENDKLEETAPEPQAVSYVTRISEPLHTCNICNSVQETAKALRRHQYKHLRCQFCKVSFRTVEEKTEHVDSKCLVKKTINNFPSVELLKIENDSEVVTQYRNSFAVHFPSLNDGANIETVSISSESDKESTPKHESTPNDELTSKPAPEIIEILSDDDDEASKVPPPVKPIKPDVRIKDDDVMDKIDPHATDLEVLKDQLSHKSCWTVEKDVQTEHPCSSSIEVKEIDMTAVFSGLKRYLHVFQVPVEMKEGSSFGATYDYSTGEPKHKSMQLWNDLTPVNINNNNTRVLTTSVAPPLKDPTFVQATVASTPVKDVAPLVSIDNSNSTTSVSSEPKPVSSTHSRIFAVVPSVVSTFPSGKRVCPPPSTINKPTDQSVPSDGSPLASEAIAEPAPKKMRISPPPAEAIQDNHTTESTSNIPVLPSPTPSTLQSILLSSVLPPATTTDAVSNTSTNSVVTVSSQSLPDITAKIWTPPLPPSEPITSKAPIPSAVANTLSNSPVTASSASLTSMKALLPPLPLRKQITLKKPKVINISLNSVVTASPKPFPPNMDTIWTPPLPTNERINFKIPTLPPPNSNTVKQWRIAHRDRSQSPKEATYTITLRPPTPFLPECSPTNSVPPRPIPSSNVNKSVVAANHFDYASPQTAVPNPSTCTAVSNNSWPVTCGAVAQPTDYSVGYSNVPTMVTNNTVVQPISRSSTGYGRRSSLEEFRHYYQPQVPKTVATAQAEATNVSVFSRKNAIRPQYQPSKPVQRPSYSDALVTLANTRQAVEALNTRSSFPSPVQAQSSEIPMNVETLSTTTISSQVFGSGIDQSYICNSIASVSDLNSSQTPQTVSNGAISQTSPTFVPRMNSTPTTACSVSSLATPQFGQIRVRNMRELT